MSNICVFTAVCEVDAKWIDQYLKEIERLDLPFVIYLDRCSQETKEKFNHPNCVGKYEQNEPREFKENDKQKALDLIPKGTKWAMAWDIDETWEKNAKQKLENLPEADYVDCVWVNLWEDDKHLRVGLGFGPRPRTKFYNLNSTWRFTSPVINGPYMQEKRDQVKGETDLACIHHGLKTKELRLEHKERWDRVYGAAIGGNPYKIWEHALDETIAKEIIDNPYV